jgi:uncharacterized protein (DUF58 family)
MLVWLDKRIPTTSSISLKHSSIFIFPSRFGATFLLLCLTLFLLGSNYQNNLMLILCYLFIGFFLVNLLASYRNFAKLTFKQGKLHPVFAGENAELPIWVSTNREQVKQPNGRLHIHLWGDKPSATFDLDAPDNPSIISMPCQTRGTVKLPRITFNSYYPFGLFRTWTHLSFAANQWVYPAPIVVSEPKAIETFTTTDTARANTSYVAGQDEFDSLKDYKIGEPLHHVAWKQVAKGRGMISKVFSSNQEAEVWLILNSANDIERQLSEFSYLVQELTQCGQRFGLNLGHTILEPSSDEDHRKRCLEALAVYSISPGDTT